MVERQLRAPRHRATSACSRRWRACRASSSCPTELRASAYADAALPIGAGQTISQPYMVALICEQLALRGGERVLDVGTGSGYQAAVLAELAAEVHSIERIPELAERGAREPRRRRLRRARRSCTSATGRCGLPEHAPFAAIAVAAAAPEPPPALYEQLEPRRTPRRAGRRRAGAAARGRSCGRRRARPCCAASRAGSCRSSRVGADGDEIQPGHA